MSLRGKLLKNKSLAEFTSWRVGGNAKCVYHPANLDDLSLFLSTLPKQEAVICLGAGTNILVPDKGIAKTVVILKSVLNDIRYDESSGLIFVGSGALSSKLSKFSIDLEFRGLEFLAGIPGTIGGALAMNAGAYGSEVWDYVAKVETINRVGERFVREKKDFEFGYRKVKNLISNEEWFVAAHFNLEKGNKKISLQIMQDWLTKRKNSQPLDLPNAGSVFKNPKEVYAARLIELCGLKGYRVGGASVSTKHANFIVNDKNATATDIESLIEFVKEKVKQQTGIELVREVKILE